MKRLSLLAPLALLSACATTQPAAVAERHAPRDISGVRHPEWSRDAVIYQINTRQFTPEGTFRAAQLQLPRLQELGVDILWLMPVQPIGQQNRKGTLGSPYSVRDYRAVNPEFGTEADFRAFVDEAHRLGMRVILDWVANHSAWDNHLAREHPEYYERDWRGNFRSTPWWDWTDIIDFDFSQPGLRRYMADSMLHWVRDMGVDGFRMDVAAYIPIDFLETVRAELDSVKPVFMLCEAEMRDLHQRACDATYAWGWNRAMHNVAVGGANTGALFGFYSENESAWPTGAMRMMYTSNHDQNSWEGTEFERFGPGLANAIVLSFVGAGIPSIYNGQEAGNDRRLQFFERDPIRWREHPNGDLFRRLIALKTANRALHNAPWGARMVGVANSAPEKIFSFVRQRDGNRVFAVFNMSGEAQAVRFPEALAHGRYRDFDGGGEVAIDGTTELRMAPWSYRIFTSG